MNTQNRIDFDRIAKAIGYIKIHHKQQPTLDELADHVHLSPFHFQRLFTEWAGVSPKQFLQYTSIEYARKLLKEERATLSETVYETGLSGTGRLHDLFIKIEGMTPAEYKNGGRNLSINYSFSRSPFGSLIVASTQRGICYMAFSEEDTEAVSELKIKFPEAKFNLQTDVIQQNALSVFNVNTINSDHVALHLKGTDFQINVWEALLKIPPGGLSTYGRIAELIKKSSAARAVGTAIGDNPVAYLIPCHRVILSSGDFGQYHWGIDRKISMIGWEIARCSIHR